MSAGVAQGGFVSPVLFSLYVNGTPPHFRHFELLQYADDTALVSASRSPWLLVAYLEAYIGRLEDWLREWRIAINISKSITMLFVKTVRRI
jgi:hypothetical protein